MQDNKDLTLLKEAAFACGTIAKSFFRKDPKVWEKGNDAGPVTEADISINRMLKSELLFNRPDFGWLSEETEETEDCPDRLSKENTFIIDPIDGTRSFISGKPTFSHSLAISRNGNVVAGVVYLPILNLMYTACEESQSTLNGKVISISKTTSLENSKLLTTSAIMQQSNWSDSVQGTKIEYIPSLAYRLCLVAEGKFDAVITLRDCWEWDIAAGDLIVRMAGGLSTDKYNMPLLYNKESTKTSGCISAGIKLNKIINSSII